MKRLLTATNATDRVVLSFIVIQSILGIASGNELNRIALLMGGNFVLILFILRMAFMQQKNYQEGRAFIHLFYPIALNIWFYTRSCEFRFVLFNQDLDYLLLKAELGLFSREWYKVLPDILNAGFLEFFHGIYFFYYLALVIFPWIVLKKQNRRVHVYVYTITVTMAIHHIFIMLFPASGPVGLRADLLPDGWFFIPVMNWIYGTLDAGGGGAFPSIHIAASMVLYFFSVSFFPGKRFLLFLFIVGIMISTIAGSFHYSIDIIAGIVTGTLAFLFIPRTYGNSGVQYG